MNRKLIRRIRFYQRKMCIWWQTRNKDLRQLEAFRKLMKIDAKLRLWPKAIPLYETAMQCCRVVADEYRWYEYARRLRDLGETELKKKIEMQVPRPEKLYQEAVKLLDKCETVSIQSLRENLGCGYTRASKILERLVLSGYTCGYPLSDGRYKVYQQGEFKRILN